VAVTWKRQILAEIVDYCNAHGSRTFTLQEFLDERLGLLQAFRPENRNVAAKVRRQFQFLRDDEILSFVDNHGTYMLRSIQYLTHEKEALDAADLWDLREKEPDGMGEGSAKLLMRPYLLPEKREHLMETYVRDQGWAREARRTFGTQCLITDCGNRFKKPNGKPYIEVHHIVPLCDGGEDAISNLSVLCAHHHRMAHFDNETDKIGIRDYLLKEVNGRLKV
jgi:predicted restriction endonuclease